MRGEVRSDGKERAAGRGGEPWRRGGSCKDLERAANLGGEDGAANLSGEVKLCHNRDFSRDTSNVSPGINHHFSELYNRL